MFNDKKLLQRLRAGEREAFEQTVQQNYQSIARQLYLLCGDFDTAADLTQETFVEAWRSLPSFRGESSLRTWLYTIALRVWHRARTQRPQRDADSRPDFSTASPENVIEQVLRAETLACALQRLPDTQREVLVLCYRQEMSHAEVARALSIPVGTVKSRLHEGLKHLRRLLGPVEETL